MILEEWRATGRVISYFNVRFEVKAEAEGERQQP